MMSKVPADFLKLDKDDIEKEIMRTGIIAELDAINLYEQMAAISKNDEIKSVLGDIIKEEKTHIGEFHEMLLRLDEEQRQELSHGKKEVDELTGKK